MDYYRRNYLRNKDQYTSAKNKLFRRLLKNELLFKFKVEFTGKRLVEYQYKNDTTIHFFTGLSLSEEDRIFFDDMMYSLGLLYIEAYRDSVKYTFSGMSKDVIVNYPLGNKPPQGFLIDTNTYVIFQQH